MTVFKIFFSFRPDGKQFRNGVYTATARSRANTTRGGRKRGKRTETFVRERFPITGNTLTLMDVSAQSRVAPCARMPGTCIFRAHEFAIEIFVTAVTNIVYTIHGYHNRTSTQFHGRFGGGGGGNADGFRHCRFSLCFQFRISSDYGRVFQMIYIFLFTANGGGYAHGAISFVSKTRGMPGQNADGTRTNTIEIPRLLGYGKTNGGHDIRIRIVPARRSSTDTTIVVAHAWFGNVAFANYIY